MAKSVLSRWIDAARSRGRKPARRPAGSQMATLGLTALESREVPASLYVDFGNSLPTSGATTNVSQLRDTLANGGLQGPNFENTPVKVGGSIVLLTPYSTIEVRPFNTVVAAFDYNRDGSVTAADQSALQNDVVSQVASYYSPFDLSVTAAAASTLTGVRTQLQANNQAPVLKQNDAYVLVAGFYYVTGGNTYSIGVANQLGGISPDVDLAANSNQRDDTVAVFADELLAAYGSAGLETATAFVAAHEAGHTLGLQHTSRSSAVNQQLTGSDIMTIGGGPPAPTQPLRTDNFFTRYPLPAASSGTVNAFDQLAADPQVGLKAGAPAYVTGTGANDVITITPSGSGATVSIQPYSDAAHTSAIGTAYSYTVASIANGITVYAGSGDDTVYALAPLSGVLSISGGGGTDALQLTGAIRYDVYNGGSYGAVAVNSGSFGGVFFQTASGSGDVVESLALVGTAGTDTFAVHAAMPLTAISVHGLGGSNSLSLEGASQYSLTNGGSSGAIAVNGGASASVYFQNTSTDAVGSLFLTGTAGSDAFAFDFIAGLSVVIDGSGSGDNDLVFLPTVGTVAVSIGPSTSPTRRLIQNGSDFMDFNFTHIEAVSR